MDQVYSFDKSLQQRLQEYQNFFSNYETISVSAIQKEWSFYLDLTIDPNGWQALWKIPRSTCETLKIPFPSVVLVFVLDINVKNLAALVRVLAVQDDIHIPEKHLVPLVQLWITKHQDKSIALNLHSTANVLDMLRFFYTNLFMPWDLEDEDTTDWKSKHLESRLRMFYDMKNGIIPRATAEHINSLLTEARHLQAKRELIESEVNDSDSEFEEVLDDNKRLESLIQLHVRMLEIKSEVEILEHPLMRKVVIKKQNEILSKKATNKSNTWLIFDEGRVDQYIEFLQEVKKNYPESKLIFSSTLDNVLETANSNDIFILNENTHNVKHTIALENGGTIKGLSSKNNTILTSEVEDVMLHLLGNNVFLENITIDSQHSKCTMLARKGKVVLKNVKLKGDGLSSTDQGIIVLSEAEIELIDCEITGFSTAIVGNSGSKINLKNCKIHEVNFGLKIFDNCEVIAERTTFHSCRDYGISIETERNIEKKIGNFETLKIIPSITTEHVKGDNNRKGDVIINPKPPIKPIEDLFSNPEYDPSIIEDDDMEMLEDVHNTTVVENDGENYLLPDTV